MERYPLADHVFYVLALLGVGLWTIWRLGAPGCAGRGVPGVPASWSRGVRGRVLGAILVAIGAAFVVLAVLGLMLLSKR